MKQKEEDESSCLREKQQNSLLKQLTLVQLTILCPCFMHLRWKETAFYTIKACNIQKQQHNMRRLAEKEDNMCMNLADSKAMRVTWAFGREAIAKQQKLSLRLSLASG